jgi:hypothetical protein
MTGLLHARRESIPGPLHQFIVLEEIEGVFQGNIGGMPETDIVFSVYATDICTTGNPG